MTRNKFDAHCEKCNKSYEVMIGDPIICPECKTTFMPEAINQNTIATKETSGAIKLQDIKTPSSPNPTEKSG